jgi:signal transduction histidine kinase
MIATVYIFCSLLVLSYEHTLIPSELKTNYFIGKILFIFGTIPIFKGLYRTPNSQQYIALLLFIVGMYCVQGEYYSPLYMFAVLEIYLPIIIMLNIKRSVLFPAIFTLPSLVLFVQYLKETGHITHARSPVWGDYLMISFIFSLIFIIIYEGYTKRKRKELEFIEKFSIIGENINIFAHNIKSILSAQYILTDNLRENIGDIKIRNELLDDYYKNLEDINKYLNDFNTLAKNETQKLNLHDTIINVLNMLRIPVAQTNIKGTSFELEIIKQDIETIFINILSNAKKTTIDNQKIEIELKKKEVIISCPFLEDYIPTSGVGLEMAKKIALKNSIAMSLSLESGKYITRLKFT